MSTAKDVKIYDLDVLVGGKKVIRLAGQDFDVSKIPLGLAFQLLELASALEKSKGDATSQLSTATSIIAEVLNTGTESTITDAWVKDNMSVEQVMAFVNILQELMDLGSDGSVDPTVAATNQKETSQSD